MSTKRRPTRLHPGTTPAPCHRPYYHHFDTSAQRGHERTRLSLLCWQSRATTLNGDDTIHREPEEKECTHFCHLYLMGTALTWWKLPNMLDSTNDVAKGTDVVSLQPTFLGNCIVTRDRMFPEETDKIERYVGGMPDPIYSSVVASKPKTMQEAIEMATELMDRRISTVAERQAESKRKFEDTPRNNQNQPPNKRQNTGRA
ncbi:hypothetical protein Tco_1216157 [Tanacetum coccineum]